MVNFDSFEGVKVDLLIATKFPSYYARHPNKVVWLTHQLRQIYDLEDSEYGIKGGEEIEKEKAIIRKLDSKFLKEAKRIFTISKNVSNRLKKYNNLESEPLYPPPKFNHQESDVIYGDFILSVGRLDPLKRYDALINAIPYFDANIKCYIAGTGREEDQLKKQAAALGVSDRVKFLGFVSDEELKNLYKQCLAVYFAPLDEDYGYITVETMNFRKPVITLSDSGGVKEFVMHGESGLISSEEPRDIAEQVNNLYKNADFAAKLGIQAQKSVAYICWDYVINKLLGVV
jgi:glycosyltransferase involved in cell wall biosynthesis